MSESFVGLSLSLFVCYRLSPKFVEEMDVSLFDEGHKVKWFSSF